MTIRAKTYTNRKQEQKVQVSMELSTAKELVKLKGEGAVKELTDALTQALK